MNSRRSKQERNNKETENTVESRQEEEIEQSTEPEIKKLNMKNSQINERSEENKEEDERKDDQYEFIMNVLHPYKKIIYKLIQLGYIRERTKFWKHSIKSCHLNALEGFCRNFFYGFVTKAVFNILLGLLNPKKNLIPNIVDLFSSNCMSFCTFLGLFSGVYKILLCSLRRIRNRDDGINAIISGAFAAFAVYFDPSKRRRKFIVLYIFCRALEALVNVFAKKGYIKKIDKFEVYMFAPLLSYLFYAYMYETECFPPGIDKMFLAWSTPTQKEFSMFRDIWNRQGKIYFPELPKPLKIK